MSPNRFSPNCKSRSNPPLIRNGMPEGSTGQTCDRSGGYGVRRATHTSKHVKPSKPVRLNQNPVLTVFPQPRPGSKPQANSRSFAASDRIAEALRVEKLTPCSTPARILPSDDPTTFHKPSSTPS
jgi:hypothetical protein